jgi:hypothetical protein
VLYIDLRNLKKNQDYKATRDSTKIVNIIVRDLITNLIKSAILSGTVSQYLFTNIIFLLCCSSVAEYYAILKNKQNLYIQQTFLNYYNKHEHKTNTDMILDFGAKPL